MSDTQAAIAAWRHSADRLAALVPTLSGGDLEGPSACAEWSVAQVLSHLGSGAELFGGIVRAGLAKEPLPGPETFPAVWDAWNARTPEDQASGCVAANEAFLALVEGVGAERLDALALGLFGMDVDGGWVVRIRMAEHVVHSWDVAVTRDPAAELDPEGVALLVDQLDLVVAHSAAASDEPLDVAVVTADPARHFRLHAGPDGVTLEAADPGTGGPSVALPAEALVRLVYGRLSDRYPARGPVALEGIALGDLTGRFRGL